MAIEAQYIELMNAQLDDEISDADRAELAKHVAANPEALAMQAELADLCGTLDAIGQLDPPPHLKYAILEALNPTKPTLPASAAVSGWRQFFAAPALGHTFAFAAGVILTLALISSNKISDQAFDDVTGLVGTMSDSAPLSSGQNFIRLSSTEIAGSVSVQLAGSLNVINFDLVAGGAVDIVAEFPDYDLWFKGFAQLENDNTRIVADKGLVRMHIQGRNRYALYLQHTSNIDVPVNIKFYAAGRLIHEAELMISAGGQKTR